MKIKKIIALILCAVMFAVLISACDNEGTGMGSLGNLFETEEAENPYPLDTKVGFIYCNEVGRDPLIAIFELARGNLERTLGAETMYMENVRTIQFAEAVEKMIEAGADIIVAASSSFNSALVLAANEHTDIMFISFGGADQKPNLASVQPRLFQAANVCGFVAAFNTDSNKIGMVIDKNMFNAHGIANAFALGVRELPNAQIDVSVNWAHSAHHDDTRRAILDLIDEGCDIIFVYQSDEYGIRLLEELGVRVIGFAYNMPDLAPTQYMTGMFLNFNTYLVDKVRQYMYGNTEAFGELTRLGLYHMMVRVTGFEEGRVAPGTFEIAQHLQEMIIDGRSTVFSGEIRDLNNDVRVSRGSTLYISQIYTVRWLSNVISSVQDFSEPLTNIIYSDFSIKQ
jgi:basic membrane lipoprotein Med (substrate-binding protein (PBP1-ABC) superfamily)